MVDQTLEELEGDQWSDSPADTHLISRCKALRRKPIGEFGIEDLRIMIGQNIGLRFLIPLALERLERNVFAAGDFYRGDLLGVVLSADRAYWVRRPSELARAQVLATRAIEGLARFKTTEEIRTYLRRLAEELLELPRPAT
jgi:hypothetical protein